MMRADIGAIAPSEDGEFLVAQRRHQGQHIFSVSLIEAQRVVALRRPRFAVTSGIKSNDLVGSG